VTLLGHRGQPRGSSTSKILRQIVFYYALLASSLEVDIPVQLGSQNLADVVCQDSQIQPVSALVTLVLAGNETRIFEFAVLA